MPSTFLLNQPVSATIEAEDTFTDEQRFTGTFPLRIRGTWDATVTLQRSDDNGTTYDDVETYTANTVKNVEETSLLGALYRIGVASGDFSSGDVEVQLG